MAVDLLEPTAPQALAPRAQPAASKAKPAARGFAGFTLPQLFLGVLLIAFALWAMWATRELQALHAARNKIVTVRLSSLVSDFVGAAARSGEPEDMLAKRTRAYMGELQKALKARSDAGDIVLVGEAVVSSSVEDITPQVAAQVAKVVPLPVARAPGTSPLPTQLPMAVPPSPGELPAPLPAQPAMAPPVSPQGVQPAQVAPADPAAGMAYPFGSGQ